MRLIDFIAAPGSALAGGMKTGAGDDRYVFDEAAGWACVIDGATDVGPVRLYPRAESDAAYFAGMFARELLAGPPRDDESLAPYFTRFAAVLRAAAEKDSRIALKDAPRASLPTAAAAFVRIRKGAAEAATLGDALAIVQARDGSISILGDAGKPSDENARARKVMAMSKADRLKWLADVRARHNTDNGYWVFGVQPEAAAHILHQSAPAPPGTRILLMTDGFYRLVSPYARYDDAGLMAAARDKGLPALLGELRGLETSAGDDAAIGRFKTSDDATALFIEA